MQTNGHAEGYKATEGVSEPMPDMKDSGARRHPETKDMAQAKEIQKDMVQAKNITTMVQQWARRFLISETWESHAR